MDEHEISVITQAATRLHAEQWHDNAFVLSLQAQAATTEYDRYWLGRDADDAERYARGVDRHARSLAAGNDPLDEWEVQETVEDCRRHSSGVRLPTTEQRQDPALDGWEHPGPPPWGAQTSPPTPAWADETGYDPDDEAAEVVADDRAPGPGQLALPLPDPAGGVGADAVRERQDRITQSLGRAEAALDRIDTACTQREQTEGDRQRGEWFAQRQAEDTAADAAERATGPDIEWE